MERIKRISDEEMQEQFKNNGNIIKQTNQDKMHLEEDNKNIEYLKYVKERASGIKRYKNKELIGKISLVLENRLKSGQITKDKYDKYLSEIEEIKQNKSNTDETIRYWMEKNTEDELRKLPEYEQYQRVVNGLKQNCGPEIKERWSEENVANYSLEQYVEEIKKSSGHLALHGVFRPELFWKCIKDGYIKATGRREDKPKGYRAAESDAVHFSIDNSFWKDAYLGVVYPVEYLLENKTFMDSPIKKHSVYQENSAGTDKFLEFNKPTEDWPVSGKSLDDNDETHKFKLEQGIIMVPRNFYNSSAESYNDNNIRKNIFLKKIEEMQLDKNKFRVYFYEGGNLQEGLNVFRKEYNIKDFDKNSICEKPIEVSGKIKKVIRDEKIHGAKGKGHFYSVE